MSHQKEPRTPGGLRLRALREACGKTQLDVELDANLGMGYLQRLELGKVYQPEQDTLNRILDALGVTFIERREVLALFGYAAPISIPNNAEVQWAMNIFQSEIKQTTMPAYLLDCSHRLLTWNALIPKLFGGLKMGADTLLLPSLIFDSANGIADSILNAETFFPAQIRIVQYEKQRCSNRTLYDTFINEMSVYPNFVKYWKQNGEAQVNVPMRPLVPMKLDTGYGLAQFRLIAETFVQDPRFRVIYYLPDDSATFRQCLDWQGEVAYL
jgi:transcriptional regulator with XRE-family HTH domain